MPLAVCVDGRRAAPPEDSRGLEGAELIEIQGDPARFDPSEINDELADLRFALREAGVAASVAATGRSRHPSCMKRACEPCSRTSGTDPGNVPIAAR